MVDAFRQLAFWLLDQGLAEGREHAIGDAARRAESIRLLRKSTKALRALLPLVTQAAPPEAIAGAERMLSDAAGLLAPLRDRDAMLKTVNRLFQGKEGLRVEEVRSLLRGIVVAPGNEPAHDRPLEDLLMVRAASTIGRVRLGVESFQFDAIDPRFVARTIARGWAGVRRAVRSDWDTGDSEAAHEVRKACGRLALQFTFLEERKPKPFTRLRKHLRDATSALGDEHDLSMLAENIAIERARFPGDDFVEAALGLCRKARERLRSDAAEAIAKVAEVRSREIRRAAARALANSEPE